MNLLTSKKSWLVAPIATLICLVALVLVWFLLEPGTCIAFVDHDGCSPLELMTLPLFALIIPLVWLCPPNAGGTMRQVRWSALWSLLALMALALFKILEEGGEMVMALLALLLILQAHLIYGRKESL